MLNLFSPQHGVLGTENHTAKRYGMRDRHIRGVSRFGAKTYFDAEMGDFSGPQSLKGMRKHWPGWQPKRRDCDPEKLLKGAA
jgi:hypothetical protein